MKKVRKSAKKAALACAVYDRLLEVYGPQKCFLNHENALELLVATILSAQCTDKMVNSVTETLFRKYRTAADYADAPLEALEEDIRKCGYYHAKAAHIKGACTRIRSDFHGKVPHTMAELTSLPGVGRKTANVVLGDYYGVPGLPVDTHVSRLSGRLGFCAPGTDAESIEAVLCACVEPEKWAQFSHLLIMHGRTYCPAGKTKCPECPISDLCPERRKK